MLPTCHVYFAHGVNCGYGTEIKEVRKPSFFRIDPLALEFIHKKQANEDDRRKLINK